MPITKYPHGVSSFGVPLMGGATIPATTGTYFFVDNTTGSNADDGLDAEHPVATIDYAIGLCTANKGDVIIVMPNHTETIATAAAINCDIEGVSIIGLGHGDNRPVINYDGTGASAATVAIAADSVLFDNLTFEMNAITGDGVLIAIDVNDNHFTMQNCEMLGGGASGQCVSMIDADANADDIRILGCKFTSVTAGCASAIDTSGALTNIEVNGCHFDGDFSVACIDAASAIPTGILIVNNYMKNDNAGEPVVSFGASATVAVKGIFANNYMVFGDTAGWTAQTTERGHAGCLENYGTTSDSISAGGLVNPAGAIS